MRPKPAGYEPAGCCSSTPLPMPPLPVSAFVETPEEKYEAVQVKEVLIILNPFGGNGRAGRVLEEISAAWLKKGLTIDVQPTTHSGHATEIAQERDLARYQALVVIGGDGTFNEVVTGLLRRAPGASPVPPLSLIPGGTGNSIANSMGIAVHSHPVYCRMSS